MNSELFDHLKAFSTNPYLFIGSGFSRRYLNLPTWEDLLSNFYVESLIDGEFEYYKSKSNGNLPMLASDLSREFHEIWWKNKKYKNSRDLNKVLASKNINLPLKIEISEYIKTIQKLNPKYENEIALLKKSTIDGIITTNWDNFLEENFSDFNVYIGQQELLFSEAISIGEIYKIHGCISRPESIVVTDEDYYDFNSKNAYLAAKLLTIFVEHPIIFIGYSLSDNNIQQIIDSIVKCVEPQNLEKLKNRLIFVEWKENADFEIKDSSMKLPDNKVLPIKLIVTDSFEPIFETLSTLKRKIPIKILRKLKNSVVEFVKSNKPTSQIFVSDINSITDDSVVEYAIGVGIVKQFLGTQGYKSIETKDIIEDILNDDKSYDSKLLIENTFPKMINKRSFVPVYKYLKSERLLNKNGTLKTKQNFELRKDTPKCFLPGENHLKKQTEIRRNHKDINSIIHTYDNIHSLYYIPLLESKNIDLKQLLKFLRKCLNDNEVNNTSIFRKVVCLYDYLKYGVE